MGDLDHWKLVEYLSRNEIARLACGLDPKLETTDVTKEANLKVDLIQKALLESSELAWTFAIARVDKGLGVDSLGISTADQFFELDDIDSLLPSIELWSEINWRIDDPWETDGLKLEDAWQVTNLMNERYRCDYI